MAVGDLREQFGSKAAESVRYGLLSVGAGGIATALRVHRDIGTAARMNPSQTDVTAGFGPGTLLQLTGLLVFNDGTGL